MALAPRPRVVIADDHAPTRKVVRVAVENAGFHVCAEAHDCDRAIRAVRETRPDVILLDVRMPGNGIRAAEVIGTEQPDVSIVMLTVSEDEDDLVSALAAGASGYVVKGQDPARVPEVLRLVLSGHAAFPDSLVKRLIRESQVRDMRRHVRARLPGDGRLTRREWEVLELLHEGLGTAEIAERLFVADVTVRSHLASIVRKLKVKDREGALRLLRGERS